MSAALRSAARSRAMARGLLAALVLLALVLLGSAAAGEGSTPPPPKPATFPAALPRIVSARVHHTRISTVRNSNSRRVGRSLAGLHPSWVSGVIRYAKGQHPNHREVRGWREITRIVRTANPQAQFDVTLNAKQYRNGGELLRMMARVRTKLDNDGWFFDFYSTAYRKRPRMIRAAISSAHANGEWIGGNVFGLPEKRPMPLRSDFLAVQDFRNLTLNRHAVQRLAAKVPVVYHLNNSPDHPSSGGCTFIQSFSTARRRALIRHRAAQQARYGFRVSYPVLFPECFRQRHGPRRGPLYSYNAFRDPPMARTIVRLLDRYD